MGFSGEQQNSISVYYSHLHDIQSDQFVVVNHSRHPDFESIHGDILPFSTQTKRCPFPTAFLWHEYRVRGHNPTRADRVVTIKRSGLRSGRGLKGGGLFDGHDGTGEFDDGAGGHEGGDHNGGAGAIEQIEGCGQEEEGYTFTPMLLEGENLVAQAPKTIRSYRFVWGFIPCTCI